MEEETKQQEQEDNGIVIDTAETDLTKLEAQSNVEETTTTATDEKPEEKVEAEPEQKKPSRSERRIRRQQDRIHELEAQLTEQKTTPDEKVQAKDVDIDDYESYDDYTKAVEEQEKAQEATPELKQLKEANNNSQIEDMLEDGAEQYEDFEEIVKAQDVAINPEVLGIVLESENPSDMAYYLATHKEETRKIAGMTLKQKEKALMRIEVKLEGKPAKTVRTTKAPEPITPVSGQSVTSKSLDDEGLSFEEHAALLQKQSVPNPSGFL